MSFFTGKALAGYAVIFAIFGASGLLRHLGFDELADTIEKQLGNVELTWPETLALVTGMGLLHSSESPKDKKARTRLAGRFR